MALAAGQTGHLSDHQEAVYTVVHGGTAGTSRPTLGSASTTPTVVLWVGTVEPTNATDNDWWWDQTNDVVKVKESGSFVSASRPLDEPIIIPGSMMGSVVGSAVYSRWGTSNVASGWLLDDSQGEVLSTQFSVPLGWSTVDISIFWAKLTTNSGDVNWRLRVVEHADGSTPTTIATDDGATETAPATQYEVVETLETAFTGVAVASRELLEVRVGRLGNAAADTLTGDIALIGLKVVRAS